MRETLIKLLDEVAPKFQFDFIENTDRVANHLLKSEQVVVLPCKLGSTIYHIDLAIPVEEQDCSDCKYNVSGFNDFWCEKDYIGWPTFEDKLYEPKSVCPKFELIVRDETFTLNFWARMEKWFNKSWFLNEDEAYKAVKEYEDETSLSEDPS